MEGEVCPTPYGILGRILPGLQTIAMLKVVCRFPVIEGLVTILYWSIKSGEGIGDKEDIESADRLNCEGGLRSS
jgi:hypothetical protein